MRFDRTSLAALLAAAAIWGQGLEYVKANYTKYEYEVPMRDGVRLFTSVYTPKDASQKYAILFLRTPYSVRPYGVDQYRNSVGPSEHLAREGYIFVYQDVRGRYMSEGEFVHARPHLPVKRSPKDIDESTDAWDTIEWALKNLPNHNGRVGMWGISYPGFYAAMGMIDAHPALKAVSPQAPIGDWFIGDDWHHNGTLFLAHTFNFMAAFARAPRGPAREQFVPFQHGTPDGYKFFLETGPLANVNEKHFKNENAFWSELMRHGTYDEFWKARNLRPHLKGIKPAVMTVGGWFDAEDLFGALNVYASVEKQSPGAYNVLVMGPWSHGGWGGGDGASLGSVSFNSKTAAFYREKIEAPFFNWHLKQKGELKLPEAYAFETGTNQWRTYDAWPPKNAAARTMYLGEHGGLPFRPPGQEGFDEYLSDPAKPVPFLNATAIGMTGDYMIQDQRHAAARPDVLVYRTEPLTEDLTLAGPVAPTLWVSTTGTDSDWVIKLIDVYPDDYPDPSPNPGNVRMGGYQQLVRGEPMRGKFRNGFENPEPFVPGQVTKIDFEMPDIYHTFRRGHRIMVHIQSTWFPLVDRNPQKFVDIYTAGAADFQKATQRVYRGGPHASGLRLRVIR
ncbi:MAG: CocE/NonD family hydrolase [Acidobacteriota bacterium]